MNVDYQDFRKLLCMSLRAAGAAISIIESSLALIINSRLLKNTHLLRCAHPSSLRRTVTYASFLLISRALHLDVFDQPGRKLLFKQPDRFNLNLRVSA